MFQTRFVDCYLPLALVGTFTYRLPLGYDGQLQAGSLVVVPFNERNIYTGIVRRVHEVQPAGYQIKDVIEVLEETPVLTESQIKLLDWISDYYLAEPGQTFHAALPSGFKISTESKIQINPSFDNREDIPLSANELNLMEALRNVPSLTYADAMKITRTKTLYHILQSLRKKEAILLFEEYKHLYKPKIVQKIRLTATFAEDKELLKELLDSIAGQEKQENILLKYLQEVPVWKNLNSNNVGLNKSFFNSQDFSVSALKTLVKKGVFEEFREIVSREVYEQEEARKEYALSDDQQTALEQIVQHFSEKDIVLLQGITGSGKTEVYISLIKEQLAQGKQVLFLMPEIALTTHMTGRLSAVFGKELGIYHSRLSENERVETWKHVQDGSCQLVLSARSGVFLPFQDLGLIVVDEEHDSSFKQNEKTPRYQARDTALVLAKMHKAKTLLGSATPSLESYHLANKGVYGYVKLDKRHGAAILPLIEFADLKQDRKKVTTPNPHADYSGMLVLALEDSIAKKEQSLLFQNRRGYAPYLSCETCGWVSMCGQCSVSLTYHQRDRRVKCHYCGHNEKVPATCPACGSGRIKTKGLGTEKIEEDLAVLIPQARIQRMDQDTTRAKNAFKNIYDALKKGEIDILVGTQMVTKGLDFENINLAGILNADQMMYYPDFRANERTFQMLTQVAGRTGRREKQGLVIVQTFNPKHYVLQYLKANDILGFYERELIEREKFNYPPYTRIIKLVFKDKDRDVCDQSANYLAQKLIQEFGTKRVFGPEWPSIDRINNFYLKEILLKFERNKVDIAKAKSLLKAAALEFQSKKEFRSTQLIVDVDPY
jgi:primosomal protein N' (replication factor Y)